MRDALIVLSLAGALASCATPQAVAPQPMSPAAVAAARAGGVAFDHAAPSVAVSSSSPYSVAKAWASRPRISRR